MKASRKITEGGLTEVRSALGCSLRSELFPSPVLSGVACEIKGLLLMANEVSPIFLL